MNKTKEGIEVRAGQVWRDLDYRMSRAVKVLHVDELANKAYVRGITSDGRLYGRKTRLSIERMHNHSTGFELVPCQPT